MWMVNQLLQPPRSHKKAGLGAVAGSFGSTDFKLVQVSFPSAQQPRLSLKMHPDGTRLAIDLVLLICLDFLSSQNMLVVSPSVSSGLQRPQC